MNIGPAEILVIMVVALLVFGPKRLPEVGKQVGGALRELRKMQDTVKTEIQSAIDEVDPRASLSASAPPSIAPIADAQDDDDLEDQDDDHFADEFDEDFDDEDEHVDPADLGLVPRADAADASGTADATDAADATPPASTDPVRSETGPVRAERVEPGTSGSFS